MNIASKIKCGINAWEEAIQSCVHYEISIGDHHFYFSDGSLLVVCDNDTLIDFEGFGQFYAYQECLSAQSTKDFG